MFNRTSCFSEAVHNDWEDIAVGPCFAEEGSRSCIYILDDGAVNGVGAKTIYKVLEPEYEYLTNETIESEAVFTYK